MAFNIVAGVNNAVYGSVSGSGSYVEGAEVTLEVTVNDGYRFVEWDDGNTDNPRVFNATEDVTLVATLEAIPEYAISVTTNDNSLGTVSGAGTFREGTSIQISATPYAHSRFVNWEDGNSDNSRTITVSATATYKAIFEAVNYFTISTDVNDANLGSVAGAGEYDEGDTVTLTAVPEIDCRFVRWNDGNTDNPRIFTSSANATYTATFEEIQYTDVTIASNDVFWGTVSGATSGNIETGTTITLTATPATDYKFDGWQVDGEVVSASPTASFLVDGQEMDIIAVFSAIVFYQVTLITNDVDCGSISVVSATAEPRGEAHNIWPDGTIINLQAVTTEGGKFLNWNTGQTTTEITVNVHGNETIRANFYPITGLILVTKKILQQTWSTIKSFFSASTGASKIGAPANNALGATTLADVVNSVGQANGLAQLNEDGKINISDLGGSSSSGLDVDITGNAATATSAASADVAAKLGTTTVGASDTPIYLNAGTATACGASLAIDITGNATTATSATNVTGTVAIANGGTGATTRLNALKALTDESVGTNATHFLTITTNWGKGGYTSVADAKKVLGIDGSIPIYYVQGPSTDTTAGTWTGSITGLTAYYDGLTVLYVPAVAGASATTLNINSLGAKTCYTTNTSALTTHYSVGTPILLTYRDNAWRRADYNSNTTYSAMSVSEGTTGTATTSRTMRADYLKQIIAALPSASCTGDCGGNAATATTAASCTGNAATATTATNTNNAKLTHTVGNTEYPLVFGTSFVITDAQQALRIGTPTATGANCALRCKAYCAAANTQGEAYIVIGNNLAKASANNSRGGLYLYGTGTTWAKFQAGDQTANKTVTLVAPADVTLTLPSATGTIALTSSDITGNAATATTATSATSATSATTATNANNIKTTSTAGAWKDIIGVDTGFTSAANKAVHGHNSGSVSFYVDANATSGNQRAILRLGNATANTTAAGHNGRLLIYGTGTTYLGINSNPAANKDITIKTTGDTAREYTLPDAAGTIALTSSDITGNAATATTAGNVTGTVAIAHGGTGATTRLNALKALTNEDVGANATYFLTITDSWGKGGYSSVANVKSILAMGASGTNHKAGLAPDPGSTAGTEKMLCEDGTWKIPPKASTCTGNAATATYATNARVTKTANTTWYDLVFAAHHNSTITTSQVLRVPVTGVESTDGTLNVTSLAVRVGANSSASGTTANTDLQIGNGIANNAADTISSVTVAARYKYNRRGRIFMYGTGSTYTLIQAANPSSSNTLTLPTSTGTLALTSDIPTSSKTTLVDLLAVLHKTTTAISSVSSYTASSDCIVRLRIGDVYWWKIYINSTLYQHQERNNGDSAVTEYVYMVLKNGDVVTASTSGASTYKFSGTVYTI